MDKIKFLFAFPFSVVGDEPESDADGGNGEIDKKVIEPPAKKTKVEFTPDQQAYLNSLLAEERRKAKVSVEKTVLQLETLKNQAGTSEAEKERLAQQITDLQSTYTTEKEMTDKERAKSDKKRQEELDKHKKETDTWKNRFTNTKIRRDIVDAASIAGQKADNPEHIVAYLSGNARLVEELDEEGKPTDNFVTKIKVRGKDKEGKPITLDMIATDAVKYMAEQDEHAKLFESGVSGGLGGNPNRPGKGGGMSDPNSPPTDQAAYREWRKQNPGAVGVTVRSTKK